MSDLDPGLGQVVNHGYILGLEDNARTYDCVAKGRRLVSLTPFSALMLRYLRERQEADGLLQGFAVNDDTSGFRYRDGSPFLPRSFSGAFTRIMCRAGLEGFRLQDARHDHATLMLRQGLHPKIVQERLGQAKVGTTLDNYRHVIAGLQGGTALRFDESVAMARIPASDPEGTA